MNKLSKFLHNGFLDLENMNSDKISKHFREPPVPEVDLDSRLSDVKNGFHTFQNIKTVANSNFCDDRISKTGRVIFFKCDFDLTLIYEVIQ